MNGKRQVQMCPAAFGDLRMLLPRASSRAIVLRHAMKLENWRTGENCVLDLEVVEIPQSMICELCIEDRFGFCCGIRIVFFEDTQSEPDGGLWVIGSRRDDEPLSKQTMDTLKHRREIVEKNGETD